MGEASTPGRPTGGQARQCDTAARPEGSEHDGLQDPEHLKNFLIEANIRLVRWEYLVKLGEDCRVWPRRQEAELEEFEAEGEKRSALVTLEEVRGRKLGADVLGCPPAGAVIVSVSHTWESQQHPDPWGWQLRSLLRHRLRGLEKTP